jgi:aconitate hydratase
LRDFWIVSEIVKGQAVPSDVSLDINPSSRQKIEDLGKLGALNELIKAGARYHQTGCMGCIGMGQAPASNTISLRTMPRNFPGRSGTADDQVYLCSPETAAVSALHGVITDPLDYGKKATYPKYIEPEQAAVNSMMLIAPKENGRDVELIKGPNITSLPDFTPTEDTFEAPIILKMGNNISTDEILKAGAEVLPLRSNIEAISKFAYQALHPSFYQAALEARDALGGHLVVAGDNYAQGSSREHAAIAPRYLGQKAVIANSYARIGFQNLVNFGIIPFVFENPEDLYTLEINNILVFSDVLRVVADGSTMTAYNKSTKKGLNLICPLSMRQRQILLAGGLINYLKDRQ